MISLIFSSETVNECPDYRTAGENSCFFSKNYTSLWVNYNITVVATNALGKNISDPVELDVVYIGMLICCHHKLFCRYILYRILIYHPFISLQPLLSPYALSCIMCHLFLISFISTYWMLRAAVADFIAVESSMRRMLLLPVWNHCCERHEIILSFGS